MNISQVAAQLYTVRDHLATPPEIVKSLRKIRAIGYEAVQISSMGPMPEEEIVQLLKDEGLVCCATHEPAKEILDETDKVIERLNRLGCPLTAYGWPEGVDFSKHEQVETLTRKLDAAGAALMHAGQVLTYHNHALEFIRYQNAPILDYIFGHSDPHHLQAELDTYWVQCGGGDPVAWCRKMKGRLPMIHLKDYVATVENKGYFAEIGQGNLDWHAIIPAAEASGCKWFIVEQDTCPDDPFESLAISFRYLKNYVAGQKT